MFLLPIAIENLTKLPSTQLRIIFCTVALPRIIYNIIIMVTREVTIKCPKMLDLWSKMGDAVKIMRPMIMDHLTGRTFLKYET